MYDSKRKVYPMIVQLMATRPRQPSNILPVIKQMKIIHDNHPKTILWLNSITCPVVCSKKNIPVMRESDNRKMPTKII
tara:strand:+ start:126 stop:359 length:234 start_codon:yes stop_codon:yes gene_type:complete